MEVNQISVQNALGWSVERYTQFQHEHGQQYIRAMGLERWESSQMFWAWFKNQWDMRDEKFIVTRHQYPPSKWTWYYAQVHELYQYDYYPHRNLITDAKV